jgi:hypothetical protein
MVSRIARRDRRACAVRASLARPTDDRKRAARFRIEQNVCAECGRLIAPSALTSARLGVEHPAFASIVAAAGASRGQNRVEQNNWRRCVRVARLHRAVSDSPAPNDSHSAPMWPIRSSGADRIPADGTFASDLAARADGDVALGPRRVSPIGLATDSVRIAECRSMGNSPSSLSECCSSSR